MLVLGNDYKHPVVTAKEAATVDLLSDGRLEFGLGAGWMQTDYDAAGMPYDSAGTRVERLAEAVEVVKAAWGDGPFDFEGKHYTIRGYDGIPKPVQRPHPPILLGGGARKMLQLAGAGRRHRRHQPEPAARRGHRRRSEEHGRRGHPPEARLGARGRGGAVRRHRAADPLLPRGDHRRRRGTGRLARTRIRAHRGRGPRLRRSR